jgi:FkbM family methyltransferase
MTLSPIHLIDGYIIKNGSYAPEIVAEIKQALRGGGDFIDVGANIGYMSLVASRISPTGTVYAFEPSPREFSSLLENIRLSGAMNITAFPLALGATSKTDTLYLQGPENPGMNTRHGSGTPTSIRIEKFSDVVPAAMLERIRCIKIDVEGDELNVLLGMETEMSRLNATFLVEVSWPERAEQIYAFFERHGFFPKIGLHRKPLDEVFTRRA